MKKIKLIAFVLLAVITLLACGCDEVTNKPTQGAEGSGSGHVIITEVISKNNTVLADEDGQYCDYIELYNPSASRLRVTISLTATRIPRSGRCPIYILSRVSTL